MYPAYREQGSIRIVSAGGVVLLHVALAWLLISGLGADMVRGVGEALRTFDVSTPVPPPPLVEPAPEAQPAAPREEGEAAPSAAPADPAPTVTPPREVFWAIPMPSAPAAGSGSDSAAGAGEPGPGTGAGGQGNGLGSGSGGSGTGGGGGVATRAELVSWHIDRTDYPRAAVAARAEGNVTVVFMVGTDGRVSNCRVHRSSGNAALDQTTCRLVEQRFRWRPARDSEGNPVAEERGWQQRWWFDRRSRTVRTPIEPAAEAERGASPIVNEVVE